MTLLELQQKREKLKQSLACLSLDMREYIKFPVETVDFLQMQHIYDCELREIKKIDESIKLILNNEFVLNAQNLDYLKKQIYQCPNELHVMVSNFNPNVFEKQSQNFL